MWGEGMKEILDLVLKKEKKAASLEKIVDRINSIRFEEGKVPLTKKEIGEIHQLLEDGVFKLELYKTPNDRYILLSKTSLRLTVTVFSVLIFSLV